MDDSWTLIGAIGVVLVAGLAVVIFAASSGVTSHATIHVIDREGGHGSEGAYLIYTDTEVFTIEDNWLKGKFDASDRWRQIELGHSYTCTATGMRLQILSLYRNLIDCQEIPYQPESPMGGPPVKGYTCSVEGNEVTIDLGPKGNITMVINLPGGGN